MVNSTHEHTDDAIVMMDDTTQKTIKTNATNVTLDGVTQGPKYDKCGNEIKKKKPGKQVSDLHF